MDFSWLQEHALVIAFYLSVALLIYFNRKKFEFQGIVALIKTKFGIKEMKKFATPLPRKKDDLGKKIFTKSTIIFITSLTLFLLDNFFNIANNNYMYLMTTGIIAIISFLTLCTSIVFYRQIKLTGILGIYVGFMGMIAMLILVGFGVYQLIAMPSADPLFAPVLPGISIPGSPFKLPLFEGLIALLVVVVIHEFSHGVVSKAHKIPIKTSGFVMFGPLPGAFVEPNEKKLQKAPSNIQLAIYAAGPLSNMLLAAFLFIIMLGASLISVSLYEPTGIQIDGYIEGQEGLSERGIHNLTIGSTITHINNQSINTSYELIQALENKKPHDQLTFTTTQGKKNITLGQDPENETIPQIGIYLDNAVQGKTKVSENQVFKEIYFWLFGNPYSTNLNKNLGLISLIFVLSFGIGLVNLLPAGPLDGGRMFLVALKQKFTEKTSLKILSIITNILFLTILILIFVPIIKALI